MKAYLKIVSGEFIQEMLGPFVCSMIANKKLTLEIDPAYVLFMEAKLYIYSEWFV